MNADAHARRTVRGEITGAAKTFRRLSNTDGEESMPLREWA